MKNFILVFLCGTSIISLSKTNERFGSAIWCKDVVVVSYTFDELKGNIRSAGVVLRSFTVEEKSVQDYTSVVLPEGLSAEILDFRLIGDFYVLLTEVSANKSTETSFETVFRVQLFDKQLNQVSEFSYTGRAGRKLLVADGKMGLLWSFIQKVDGMNIQLGKKLLFFDESGHSFSSTLLDNKAFNCSTPNESLYCMYDSALFSVRFQDGCAAGKVESTNKTLLKLDFKGRVKKSVILAGKDAQIESLSVSEDGKLIVLMSKFVMSSGGNKSLFAMQEGEMHYYLKLFNTDLDELIEIDISGQYVKAGYRGTLHKDIQITESGNYIVMLGQSCFLVSRDGEILKKNITYDEKNRIYHNVFGTEKFFIIVAEEIDADNNLVFTLIKNGW